jgi:hypothetical protein
MSDNVIYAENAVFFPSAVVAVVGFESTAFAYRLTLPSERATNFSTTG